MKRFLSKVTHLINKVQLKQNKHKNAGGCLSCTRASFVFFYLFMPRKASFLRSRWPLLAQYKQEVALLPPLLEQLDIQKVVFF